MRLEAKKKFLEATCRFRRHAESLLILCYHGVSKSDEHQWNPRLYVRPEVFRRRLETLRDFGFQVLPLGIGLSQMHAKALSGPAVVITFDDGWQDFHEIAWPILQAFDYSATVYQTTYYSQFNRPVFDPACSYLLWKGMGRVIRFRELNGTVTQLDLRQPVAVEQARRDLLRQAREQKLSAEQKDRLLQGLAEGVDFSYEEMLRARILHLMNNTEIGQISRRGIDVQLHTHRHRLPFDKKLFLRELNENRASIEKATGLLANQFCYPNGEYRPEIVQWLRDADIHSATTCVPGRASCKSDQLLLPRIVDSSTVSQRRFESWLAGVGLIAPKFKQSIRRMWAGAAPSDGPSQDTGEEASLVVTATSASAKAAKTSG